MDFWRVYRYRGGTRLSSGETWRAEMSNNGHSPTWVNVRVKLGDLKPWQLNPRHITKKQAERLQESFDAFGQVETIAVGPDLDVYNGHQRLSVLHKLYGPNYEIDARQADRPLTDEERRKLVVYLHAGAVGSWDWDALSSWPADSLTQDGFDLDLLREWNSDSRNLLQFLNSEGIPIDPQEEWRGMPEFEQEDKTAFRSILVHFDKQEDVDNFSVLINQVFTDKTRSIWFPFKAHENLKVLEYKSES